MLTRVPNQKTEDYDSGFTQHLKNRVKEREGTFQMGENDKGIQDKRTSPHGYETFNVEGWRLTWPWYPDVDPVSIQESLEQNCVVEINASHCFIAMMS